MLYYSGSTDSKNRNGVAILIRNEIVDSVMQFILYLDRVMLLQLEDKLSHIHLIQVYAPTADKEKDDIEKVFYNQILEILKVTKRGEITIVMRDWNA